MPTFKRIQDVALAFPINGSSNPANIYHRAFCLCCQEFVAAEYACWAAVQQFKIAPSKRRAIFIVDTWLRPASAAIGQSMNQSIFDPINSGSIGSVFSVAKRDALLGRIEDIKSVKSWSGKLQHFGERAERGAVTSDLLSGLEDVLLENLNMMLSNKPFDSERIIQGSAYYALSLRVDGPMLKAATFDTDLMGLW